MMKYFRWVCRLVLLSAIGFLWCPMTVYADGVFVGRVYDPYVQPLETELEYQGLAFDGDSHRLDGDRRHNLSVGHSLSDRWYAEVGAEIEGENDLALSSVEAEIKWQLTEQGEFAVDWGLLFEAEVEKDSHIREIGARLIMVKEWSRWVTTANAGLVYEFGGDIQNEWETNLSGQLRYRFSRAIEPGFEVFASQGYNAAGPMLNGLLHLSSGRQLHWETGVYWALHPDTPDTTFRVLLEYEFY